MLAIYKRELKSYFQSMVGCVFVAFLLVFTGIYFVAYNLSAGYPYFSYSLAGSLIVFIVGIPLITMRSFSEERKNKTDQLLLTAPVSLWKVVLGKYLAVFPVFYSFYFPSRSPPLPHWYTKEWFGKHFSRHFKKINEIYLEKNRIAFIGIPI